MRLRIVVDANILISALLGGKSRFILFDPKFEFITNEFTLREVEKYIPLISEKSGVPEKEIRKGITLLPLKIVSKNYYRDYLKQAEKLIGKIDKDDREILALYLKERTFLWSEDKDFEKVKPKINLLKTKDLI
jgi:predicted nucleic acid-binding protein